MFLLSRVLHRSCDWKLLIDGGKNNWKTKDRASVKMDRDPSGETWSGKSTSNQDLVLSCFGRMDAYMDKDQSALPDGCALRLEVTRRKLTQKADANTNDKTSSGRRSIVSSWLSSKFVGEENVPLLSHSPQRFICKCHTCHIVSSCVSCGCQIAHTSRCKLQNNPLLCILASFWRIFLVICRQKNPKIKISTAVFVVNWDTSLAITTDTSTCRHAHTHTQMLKESVWYTSADRQYSVTSQPHLGLSLIKNVCLDDAILSLSSCDRVICPRN